MEEVRGWEITEIEGDGREGSHRPRVDACECETKKGEEKGR